jgi:hypothetical protein
MIVTKQSPFIPENNAGGIFLDFWNIAWDVGRNSIADLDLGFLKNPTTPATVNQTSLLVAIPSRSWHP